jgi:hypothetical protein
VLLKADPDVSGLADVTLRCLVVPAPEQVIDAYLPSLRPLQKLAQERTRHLEDPDRSCSQICDSEARRVT